MADAGATTRRQAALRGRRAASVDFPRLCQSGQSCAFAVPTSPMMKPYTLNKSEAAGALSQYVVIEPHRRGLYAKVVCPSIGQREAPIISGEIIEAIDRHGGAKGNFVLDLSGVNQLTSMGLGMCIDVRNRVASAKLKPYLFGTNRSVLDLLRMMKIDKLFTVIHAPDDLGKLLG
jgi:anti-anti-sigma regulatory factor